MKIKETNKKNKKGFTMIEVLIVVAIIAVLSITIIPMISNYIQKGKDDYNAKLKNQLLVSGKEYYTNNKVKLPVKNYLGAYKNGKDYSYVALPEMQSGNYVSKDFVDADKRECSKSYVYVRQNDDNKDYEWHACLICSGEDGETINYSEGDPACKIVDWGDTKDPTCTPANYIGGKTNGTKVFNPEQVYLRGLDDDYNDNKKGNLSVIEIKNKTTNKIFYVKANENIISNQDIDLMKKINQIIKEKSEKEGEYEIRIYDTMFRKSNTCASFIIDNTAPTCTMPAPSYNNNKKELIFNTFAKDRRKDDIEGQEKFKTTISANNSESFDSINKNGQTINPGEFYTYDVTGKIGQYYGYVMDEAGNIGTCNQKVDMIPGEDPTCFIDDTDDTNWYTPNNSKRNSKTMYAECYVAGGIKATIDTNQIVLAKKSGTIDKAPDTAGNTDTKNKVRYKITYKPKNNQYFIDEQVVINPGFVTDSSGAKNTTQIPSKKIKVDSIAPKITYTPLTTKQSGGWYKSPFELKMSCSDNSQSGVKTFKVNGTTVANPKTITRKKAAKPGTWKTSCTDKAGNSSSGSKDYYVRVYSANKACSCKTYKRCSSCGCASGYYSYYWSGLRVASGGASACTYCSSCNAHCYNLKSYTDRCTRRGANQEMYYGSCLRSYHCSYYKRCSKCACETRQKCWHY